MKTYLTMLVKSLAFAIAAIAILTLSQGAARADEVTIAGTAGGCFGTTSTPCTPAGTGQSQSASLLGLTYRGSSFNTTTSSGFTALGGNPTPGSNFNNLGSFTLSSAPNNYNGNTFTLRVTFTAPSGITGGNPATFTANLLGSVTSTGNGGVSIHFSNPSQVFTFSGPNGHGTFTFNVTDFDLNAGQTGALHGNITGASQTATVPEPTSLLLLGSGLTGLAGLARRRKMMKLGR